MNPQNLVLPEVAYSAILPELILIGAALVLLVISSLIKERLASSICAAYTVVAGSVALISAFFIWADIDDATTGGVRGAFSNAIARDHYSMFFVVVISAALILGALLAHDWLERHAVSGPELYVLMMLSASGGMIMAAANDLIVVFLGLEILSLALYVLAGFQRRREASREAALKYFVLGAFSSAIFLYGVALTYGATGSTNLSAIGRFLSANVLLDSGLLLAGMALMIVGLAFKVGAVPFHQWTPDVYEGSPTPVTAFMGAAAKAAGFAAFLRIFGGTLINWQFDWQPIILAIAVLTLLVGSIVACVQTNVKRMLAYSSISHAGYILLGLYAASSQGIAGSLFYIFAYTFMVVGSFAVVAVIEASGRESSDINTYRGLSRTRPVLAFAFTIFLLAQAGVPLTVGFLAKFYVISAVVSAGSYGLAVFAMLMAAVAAFFYLRIVLAMYTVPAGYSAVTLPNSEGEPAPFPEAPAAVSQGLEEVAEAPATAASPADAGGAVALQTKVEDDIFPDTGTVPVADRQLIPPATWIVLAITVLATVVFGVIPQGLSEPIDFLVDPLNFARTAARDLLG